MMIEEEEEEDEKENRKRISLNESCECVCVVYTIFSYNIWILSPHFPHSKRQPVSQLAN